MWRSGTGSQIPPELLEIEFTESIVLDNAGLLLRTVNALKQAGFACSIDDFGKGYSSLSLLKDLPADTLKIDRFFFEDGTDEEREWAIIQGVVDLVHRFHIHTVAEGIETPEQVRRLREVGCDYVQGFVFYHPMTQEDYERELRRQEEAPAPSAAERASPGLTARVIRRAGGPEKAKAPRFSGGPSGFIRCSASGFPRTCGARPRW